MAWLWSSWEEYVDRVVPTSVDHPGRLRQAQLESWFETEQHLFKAVNEIERNLRSLHDLGFTGDDSALPPNDSAILDEAARFVVDLIYAGEELLLYHKRLAKSDAAYGFLHSNHLSEHWERYSATGRISREINQLITDTRELLSGYEKIVQEDERFLVNDLDLPHELEADFRLARNLFSVGFDDVGVLIAGRALEGVLRRIAKERKIKLVIKGDNIPAAEADVYDLIETMYRIRWQASGAHLITVEIKALLHYLRALRNEGAHSGMNTRRATISPRETVTLVAETANQLWKEITSTRTRLVSTTVNKDW